MSISSFCIRIIVFKNCSCRQDSVLNLLLLFIAHHHSRSIRLFVWEHRIDSLLVWAFYFLTFRKETDPIIFIVWREDFRIFLMGKAHIIVVKELIKFLTSLYLYIIFVMFKIGRKLRQNNPLTFIMLISSNH